nr:hypothetical protein BaRGS_007419 [Batillaria attramentaria]
MAPLAFLPIGTDVSAKYRGAFCEAKVKKVIKSVKLFDDADERTLRRTQLCLKGEKHFMESETLDNLPLSNPEHFGTPVLQNKKARRGKPGESESEDEESSSEDEAPRRAVYKGRYQELVGKVMCMESSDKRKGALTPVVVVLPDAQPVELKNREQLLVRSFRDAKFLVVNRKDLKDFSREIAIKSEDKNMKAAFEKALLYYDSHELPPNWKREELLGPDDDSDEEEDDTSDDDEPCEEKDRFVAQLYKFMDDRGTPINKGPCVGNKDLNLYRLFRVVQNIGGYNRSKEEEKPKSKPADGGQTEETEDAGDSTPMEESDNEIVRRSTPRREKAQKEEPKSEKKDDAKTKKEKEEEKKEEVKKEEVKEERKKEEKREERKSLRHSLKEEEKREVGKTKEEGKKEEGKTDRVLRRERDEKEEEVKKEPEENKDAQKKRVTRRKSGRFEEEKKDSDEKEEEEKSEPDKTLKDKKEKKPIVTRKEKSARKKPEEEDGAESKDKESEEAESEDESVADGQEQEEYPAGTKLRVKYGRGRNQKIYEAKVVESGKEGPHKNYLVHYAGWNTRYDEWVRSERIVAVVDKPEMTKLKKKAQLLKTPKTRSTRSNSTEIKAPEGLPADQDDVSESDVESEAAPPSASGGDLTSEREEDEELKGVLSGDLDMSMEEGVEPLDTKEQELEQAALVDKGEKENAAKKTDQASESEGFDVAGKAMLDIFTKESDLGVSASVPSPLFEPKTVAGSVAPVCEKNEASVESVKEESVKLPEAALPASTVEHKPEPVMTKAEEAKPAVLKPKDEAATREGNLSTETPEMEPKLEPPVSQAEKSEEEKLPKLEEPTIPELKKIEMDVLPEEKREVKEKEKFKVSKKTAKDVRKGRQSEMRTSLSEIPTLEPMTTSVEVKPKVEVTPSPYDFTESELDSPWQPEITKKWEPNNKTPPLFRDAKQELKKSLETDKKKVKKKPKKTDEMGSPEKSNSVEPQPKPDEDKTKDSSAEPQDDKPPPKKKGRKKKELSADIQKDISAYEETVNSVVESCRLSAESSAPLPAAEEKKEKPVKKRKNKTLEAAGAVAEEKDGLDASKKEPAKKGVKGKGKKKLKDGKALEDSHEPGTSGVSGAGPSGVVPAPPEGPASVRLQGPEPRGMDYAAKAPQADLGQHLAGEQRISFLMSKIMEIRKEYSRIKSEIAAIDRKRKRARRREKEKESK